MAQCNQVYNPDHFGITQWPCSLELISQNQPYFSAIGTVFFSHNKLALQISRSSNKSCRMQRTMALFTCFMSRTISANEQCFSLITNQRTVLSAMAFQQSEQGHYIILFAGINIAFVCLVTLVHACIKCGQHYYRMHHYIQ